MSDRRKAGTPTFTDRYYLTDGILDALAYIERQTVLELTELLDTDFDEVRDVDGRWLPLQQGPIRIARWIEELEFERGGGLVRVRLTSKAEARRLLLTRADTLLHLDDEMMR